MAKFKCPPSRVHHLGLLVVVRMIPFILDLRSTGGQNWHSVRDRYYLVLSKMVFRGGKLGGLPFEQVQEVLPLDALRGPPEVIKQDHLGVLDMQPTVLVAAWIFKEFILENDL